MGATLSQRLLGFLMVPPRLVWALTMNIIMTLNGIMSATQTSEKSTSKHATITSGAVGDLRYFGWRMYNLTRNILREAMVDAHEEDKSPNPTMLRYDTKKTCQLLDVAKAGRPLVINFGSCS